jgi:hypothetical protein
VALSDARLGAQGQEAAIQAQYCSGRSMLEKASRNTMDVTCQ